VPEREQGSVALQTQDRWEERALPTAYFHRVARETPTRMWINLPTLQEAREAIEAGAVSCTTNPTYGARLLDVESEYIQGVITSVVRETRDVDVAAERVYHRATQRIMEIFLPLYERSGGTEGFVTIQGDPHKADDPNQIVGEMLRASKLGPNFMAKIPAVPAGLAAIEALVARNVPVCATEVFTIAQTIDVCERYRRAAQKSGYHPPFYVTHITGIFDRYMSEFVQREGIAIRPDILAQAGWAVAHEQYRVFTERGYEGTMLGGGALHPSHFTEMVGGNMHVTLNPDIVRTLVDLDGPVVSRLEVPAPPDVVAELSEKLPAFRQAIAEDGLAPDEYKSYGPLDLFRTIFINGYTKLVRAVEERLGM
jgi:transaldolase